MADIVFPGDRPRNPLTIAQIIEMLRTYPQDAFVYIECIDATYSTFIHDNRDMQNCNMGVAKKTAAYSQDVPHYKNPNKLVAEQVKEKWHNWEDDCHLPIKGDVIDTRPCLVLEIG